jgi:hypothetical protein
MEKMLKSIIQYDYGASSVTTNGMSALSQDFVLGYYRLRARAANVDGTQCLPTLAAKANTPQGWGTHDRCEITQPGAYSIFGIGIDRKHTLKWLFHQEKTTFHGSQKVYAYSKNVLEGEARR